MIDISNLSYSVNDRVIIKDINLKVFENGIYSIIGPNGSGKTTFLKSIIGFIKPEGKVLIENTKLSKLEGDEKSKLITYCSDLNYETDLKVEEIFQFAREDEKKELLEKYIEKFELQNFLTSKVSSLSGGERQRVALACAFYQDTRIVLLDEPTNFLDPLHIDKLRDVIIDSGKDKVLIIVSHNLSFVFEISKRILCLENGKITYDNSRKDMIKNNTLDKVFKREFKIIDSEDGVYLR